MEKPDACVYCGIIRGELAASRVAETDNILAFMDIDPVTPGHMVVIPKAHLVGLGELSDHLAFEMLSKARALSQALRTSAVRCDGVNLFLADGEAAGQEIFHVHLHVFPRYEGDGFRIDANWGSEPSREELDRIARSIRMATESESPSV